MYVGNMEFPATCEIVPTFCENAYPIDNVPTVMRTDVLFTNDMNFDRDVFADIVESL